MADWKDTLMSPEQMVGMKHKWEIRDAQAEISFKAQDAECQAEIARVKYYCRQEAKAEVEEAYNKGFQEGQNSKTWQSSQEQEV